MRAPIVAGGGTSAAVGAALTVRRALLVVAAPGESDSIVALLDDGLVVAPRVFRAAGLADAESVLNAVDVACILIDVARLDGDPLDDLGHFRDVAPHAAVVALTRGDDDEAGIIALQRGAHECVSLDRAEPETLARAVRFALQRMRGALEGEINEILVAERELLARAVVESLEAETVVVAGDGTVVAANERWLESALFRGSAPQHRGAGASYLELCDDAARAEPLQLAGVPGALRAVLAGTSPSFGVEFSAASASGRRWYELTATPLAGLPGAIVSHADITARKSREARLASLAVRDPLTGLPNRELLMDRLSGALARARRDGGVAGVIMVDLDDFKVVNDSLGRQAGDQLLAAVAARLVAVLGEETTVARLGGDEFCVLCEGLRERHDVETLARRLSSVLDAPFMVGGREIFLRASIGVAVGGLLSGGAAAVVQEADTAMYRAKAQGRGRVQVFDDAMRTRARERLWIGNGLHAALDHLEFRLHFQPIVELASGRITGAEALLRWQRPDGVIMEPTEFVPLAEETGTIHPIGRWTLSAACAEMSELIHHAPTRSPFVVSVNLSASQLASAHLAEDVAWALAAGGCEGMNVCLEITEGTLMEDVPAAARNLAALRRLGVSLAIDDFGTGYSSMLYVKHFLVDVLKIDRSFVAGLGRSQADTAIVRATISLAHSLGAPVIAEGVETAAQLAALRRLGCDAAQGYHISRPLPYAAFAELYGQRRTW